MQQETQNRIEQEAPWGEEENWEEEEFRREQSAPDTQNTQEVPQKPDTPGIQNLPDTQNAPAAPSRQEEKSAGPTPSGELTLRVLHEERKVSLEEAKALAQKGLDYDRIKADRERLRQEKEETGRLLAPLRQAAEQAGFEDLRSFLEHQQVQALMREKGLEEPAARAQVALQRREQELLARERELSAAQAARQDPQARREQEIRAFVQAYPTLDYRQIPREVFWQAEQGDGLMNAYLRYENRRLSAQLTAQRQAAANHDRSPGSRESLGQGSKEDEFLAGFEEE